jgi:hypothetical protein
MSNSTPSACLPEMKRRPTMSRAFTAPSPAMTPTRIQSMRWSCGRIASSMTLCVKRMSAIDAAWDAAASTIETTRDHRYGRRNPSNRAKILR